MSIDLVLWYSFDLSKLLLGKEDTMASASFDDSPRNLRRSFSFRAEVYFTSMYRKKAGICSISERHIYLMCFMGITLYIDSTKSIKCFLKACKVFATPYLD
jgi:hypothetical protein